MKYAHKSLARSSEFRLHTSQFTQIEFKVTGPVTFVLEEVERDLPIRPSGNNPTHSTVVPLLRAVGPLM
jgi:hypothetical protein